MRRCRAPTVAARRDEPPVVLPLSGSRVRTPRPPGRRTVVSVTNLLSSSDAAASTQAEVDAEIAAVRGRRAAGGGRAAAAPRLPAVPQQPAAAPHQGPAPRRPRGDRAVGAGLRASRRRPARGRPDHPAPRRAGRRADRRHRPGARRRRPAGAPPARRDLAGQRRRPLHPQARPAPGPDRPELHRRRPLPDRRRRHLHVHHDQARPLPVEEPPQRLAAGAHPLLAVRHRLHPADDHPDVLPGRPAVRPRPDLPVDRSTRGRASGWWRRTTTT